MINWINCFTKIYEEKTEKGETITSVKHYKWEGYGIDVQSIFAEFEYKFSIPRGVIQQDTFVRYVDESGKTYNSFIRRS